MKKLILSAIMAAGTLGAFAADPDVDTVYYIKDITPENLVKMGNIKYGSGIFLQCIFENFFGIDIQMVRWLIKN